MKPQKPCEENQFLSDHVELMITSYKKLTGRSLIKCTGTGNNVAQEIFTAPFALVSHDTSADPIFNYGNKTALRLFEMSWDEFICLRSKHSAEPVNQKERAVLLNQVAQHGFIDDYSGIRISKSGRRFTIEKAIVWNLIDSLGHHRGQAAKFDHWKVI